MKKIAIGLVMATVVGCTSVRIQAPDGTVTKIKDFHPLRRHAFSELSLVGGGQTLLNAKGFEGDTSEQANDLLKQIGNLYLQMLIPKLPAVPTPPASGGVVIPPVMIPQPKPAPPAPEPPAPVVGDTIDISGARLVCSNPQHNRNPVGARVIDFLKGARMDEKTLWLDYDGFPDWPNADGEGGTCARNFLFWKDAAGAVVGGHFEWSTQNRKDRGLKNIREGYLSEKPARGAPCWTCTVRNDWTERSYVVAAGLWPE